MKSVYRGDVCLQLCLTETHFICYSLGYGWTWWNLDVQERCSFTGGSGDLPYVSCICLQVDVIESQYGLLLDTINSTRDFEAIKLAHEHFLAALLAQSFVHMKSVSSHWHLFQTFLTLLCHWESFPWKIMVIFPGKQAVTRAFLPYQLALFILFC